MTTTALPVMAAPALRGQNSSVSRSAAAAAAIGSSARYASKLDFAIKGAGQWAERLLGDRARREIRFNALERAEADLLPRLALLLLSEDGVYLLRRLRRSFAARVVSLT